MRHLGVAVGLALLVACERAPLVDGLGGGGDGMMVWGRRIAFGCAVPAVHVGFDGGVSTIVDGVLALGLHTVVVASNGASLAFVPADDLAALPTFVVFDRATAVETAVRPGYPMAFSPDGAEVLFNEGAPNTEQIVNVATGDVRAAGFGFDPEALESLLAVKWGDDLEALASSPGLGGDETIWHLRRVGPAGVDLRVGRGDQRPVHVLAGRPARRVLDEPLRGLRGPRVCAAAVHAALGVARRSSRRGPGARGLRVGADLLRPARGAPRLGERGRPVRRAGALTATGWRP